MTKKKLHQGSLVPVKPNGVDGGVTVAPSLSKDLKDLMHRAARSPGNAGVRMIADFLPRGNKDELLEERAKDHFEAVTLFEPRDPIESMLAAKVLSLGKLGSRMLYQVAGVSDPQVIQSAGNIAVKLLRLQNETIEALSRWRRQGEQRIVIQHQNVNVGGSIGNLVAGTVGLAKLDASPQSTDAIVGSVLEEGEGDQDLGGNSP